MNKIVLEQLDENNYSYNHLNLTIEGTNKTLLIEKDRVKNIEIIRHYKVFDEYRFEFIFFVEGKVFSFKTNVIEYYEPLLLGCEYSDNAKFNKNSEQISRTLDKTDKNLKTIQEEQQQMRKEREEVDVKS